MVSKRNQHKKIADYLDRHPEGITPFEAFVCLHITKLSTRIGEMVRDGYPIRKIMEYKMTDDGTLVHYMRYWRGEDA